MFKRESIDHRAVPLDLDAIALLLTGHVSELPSDGRTRAAVAMILRQAEGLEVLLIQRAAHELDPWSGHLAFPGGKVEPGEEPRLAAERETWEEVGIDLRQARYLGPLGEITGRTLPVRVSGYVYLVGDLDRQPVLNEEVFTFFWVRLDDLLTAERHVSATVFFDGGAHQVPAIQLARADTPVLWGLTYRLVMHFLDIAGRADAHGVLRPALGKLQHLFPLQEEIMIERKGIITFKGNPMTLLGPELKVGDRAPEFNVVDIALAPVTLASSAGKIRIISAVPSLDTPVCDTETRRFNQEAANLPGDVVVLTISLDLPFAQKRWCGAAGIDRVTTLSDYRDRSFGTNYGVLIKELMLLSRSIFVIDASDTIRYIQHVSEVTSEPAYDAVLNAVRQLQ